MKRSGVVSCFAEHVGAQFVGTHASGALNRAATVSRDLALPPVGHHALADAKRPCQLADTASTINGLS